MGLPLHCREGRRWRRFIKPGARRPGIKGVRLGEAGALGEFDGGAVGEHFGHALGDLGGGEADVEDGIGSHGLGLGDHAVGGLVAGFLKHFGVAGDFAADDGFESGHEVAADMLGANSVAADDAQVFGDLAAVDGFGSGGDHVIQRVVALGRETATELGMFCSEEWRLPAEG